MTFYDMRELTAPSYEPLVRISRCLHFDDVIENHQKNAMVSQPIKNTRNYSIRQLKVLWFAPTKKSFDESNFYGNVSYVINWKDVLKKFGPYMYAIDQATLAFKSFSRILLTEVRHPELTELDNNYLIHKKSPLKFDYFEYSHADRCRCSRQNGDHELQIGIEETNHNQAGKWLFANCQEIANDHTDVNVQNSYGNNRFQSYKCYKFNTIQKLACPFQSSKSQSDRTLNDIVTKQKEKNRQSVAKIPLKNGPLLEQTKSPLFGSSSENSSSYTQNNLTVPVTALPSDEPITIVASPIVEPISETVSPSVKPSTVEAWPIFEPITVAASSSSEPIIVVASPNDELKSEERSSSVLSRTFSALCCIQPRTVAVSP